MKLMLHRWVVVAAICGSIVGSSCGTGRADELAAPSPVDEPSLDSLISREEWAKRVNLSRERSEQARRDWLLRPREAERQPDPPEKLATERVLNDGSLQPGDIVVTDKGSFLFKGRSYDGKVRLEPVPTSR